MFTPFVQITRLPRQRRRDTPASRKAQGDGFARSVHRMRGQPLFRSADAAAQAKIDRVTPLGLFGGRFEWLDELNAVQRLSYRLVQARVSRGLNNVSGGDLAIADNRHFRFGADFWVAVLSSRGFPALRVKE